MSAQINLRAEVSSKAHLGSNVSIGPFTIVEDGAVIGDGTVVGGNALIGGGARIGKDCRIHHGAIVGHMPQDLKYAGEPTTCEIGDRTVIREYTTLHRGTGDTGRTIIGSDCFIMGYVHIAHDCVIGNKVIMSNAAMLAGHCIVEDNVTLGGILAIHQFVRIGRHSMIGGGLRVGKDIPPYSLAGGEPLRFEGLNSIGLRRRGFSREVLDILEKTFNVLYYTGLNVTQALEKIRKDQSLMAFQEVQHVVQFISDSQRGIIVPPRRRQHADRDLR
ncbi:MAG: acyl-ACP--UDP-N-acetylglucosamine O-acyltransferase [Ignavibacteriae bacterium]|nr:acyl-ACP--UDP-N-acetylglucosamine O-acyltransferase [Ignavibacteriota bacterium]